MLRYIVSEKGKKEMMMEALKNIGFMLLFVTVYVPLVSAYVAGGFGKMIAELKADAGSDAASNLAKYGEADDY
jgi:hypothetical protein